MTIAMVGDSQARSGAADVVARLAELAATDELLVLYGLDDQRSGTSVPSVVAGLRGLLPRHCVVPLYVVPRDGSLEHDTVLLDDLLDVGSLPIVVTPTDAAPDLAAELCQHLAADRVLRVSYTAQDGADLHPMWHRGGGSDPRPVCVRPAA
jgi:hypothetical protein